MAIIMPKQPIDQVVEKTERIASSGLSDSAVPAEFISLVGFAIVAVFFVLYVIKYTCVDGKWFTALYPALIMALINTVAAPIFIVAIVLFLTDSRAAAGVAYFSVILLLVCTVARAAGEALVEYTRERDQPPPPLEAAPVEPPDINDPDAGGWAEVELDDVGYAYEEDERLDGNDVYAVGDFLHNVSDTLGVAWPGPQPQGAGGANGRTRGNDLFDKALNDVSAFVTGERNGDKRGDASPSVFFADPDDTGTPVPHELDEFVALPPQRASGGFAKKPMPHPMYRDGVLVVCHTKYLLVFGPWAGRFGVWKIIRENGKVRPHVPWPKELPALPDQPIACAAPDDPSPLLHGPAALAAYWRDVPAPIAALAFYFGEQRWLALEAARSAPGFAAFLKQEIDGPGPSFPVASWSLARARAWPRPERLALAGRMQETPRRVLLKELGGARFAKLAIRLLAKIPAREMSPDLVWDVRDALMDKQAADLLPQLSAITGPALEIVIWLPDWMRLPWLVDTLSEAEVTLAQVKVAVAPQLRNVAEQHRRGILQGFKEAKGGQALARHRRAAPRWRRTLEAEPASGLSERPTARADRPCDPRRRPRPVAEGALRARDRDRWHPLLRGQPDAPVSRGWCPAGAEARAAQPA